MALKNLYGLYYEEYSGIDNGIKACESWYLDSTIVRACAYAQYNSKGSIKTKCDFQEEYLGDVQSKGIFGEDCDPNRGEFSQSVKEQKAQDERNLKIMAFVVAIIVAILVISQL